MCLLAAPLRRVHPVPDQWEEAGRAVRAGGWFSGLIGDGAPRFARAARTVPVACPPNEPRCHRGSRTRCRAWARDPDGGGNCFQGSLRTGAHLSSPTPCRPIRRRDPSAPLHRTNSGSPSREVDLGTHRAKLRTPWRSRHPLGGVASFPLFPLPTGGGRASSSRPAPATKRKRLPGKLDGIDPCSKMMRNARFRARMYCFRASAQASGTA